MQLRRKIMRSRLLAGAVAAFVVTGLAMWLCRRGQGPPAQPSFARGPTTVELGLKSTSSTPPSGAPTDLEEKLHSLSTDLLKTRDAESARRSLAELRRLLSEMSPKHAAAAI